MRRFGHQHEFKQLFSNFARFLLHGTVVLLLLLGQIAAKGPASVGRTHFAKILSEQRPTIIFGYSDPNSENLAEFSRAAELYATWTKTQTPETTPIFYKVDLKKNQDPYALLYQIYAQEGIAVARAGYTIPYRGSMDSASILDLAMIYSGRSLKECDGVAECLEQTKRPMTLLCVGTEKVRQQCQQASHHLYPRFNMYYLEGSGETFQDWSVYGRISREGNFITLHKSSDDFCAASVIAFAHEAIVNQVIQVDDLNHAAFADWSNPVVYMIFKTAESITPKALSFFRTTRGLIADLKTSFLVTTLESKFATAIHPKNARIPSLVLAYKGSLYHYSGALSTSAFSAWISSTSKDGYVGVKMLDRPQLDNVMRTAVANHQSGKLDEAMKGYLAIVEVQPNYSLGHYNLGVLYQQMGHSATAHKYFQQSIALDPYFAELLVNLGDTYTEEQKYYLAVPAYKANVELNPKDISNHHLLASRYELSNMTLMAAIHYESMLRIMPNHVQAVEAYTSLLGNSAANFPLVRALYKGIFASAKFLHTHVVRYAALCEQMGMFEEIVDVYQKYPAPDGPERREYLSSMNGHSERLLTNQKYELSLLLAKNVIRTDPTYVRGYVSLGNSYARLMHRPEAIAAYRKGIQLLSAQEPEDLTLAGLHANLGQVLLFYGDYEGSYEAIQTSLAIEPNSTIAMNNLGMLYIYQRNLSAAIAIYEKALQIEPNNSELLTNLATSLIDSDRSEEAIEHLEKALELDPNQPNLVCDLAHAKKKVADHNGLEELTKKTRLIALAQIKAGHNPCTSPISSITFPFTPAEALLVAQVYSRELQKRIAPHPSFTAPLKTLDDQEVIHLGFMSSDFRIHPVGYLIAGLFARINRIRFRVHCFSLRSYSDKIQQDIQTGCDEWVDLSRLSAYDMVSRLRQSQIDILVDLNGHTQYARYEVLMERVAAIQMTFLGFAGTTGAPNMDYFVSDSVASPPSEAKHYSEKLLLLPHSYMVNNLREQHPQLPSGRAPSSLRRVYGLPDTAFIFCNFNQHHKIDPQIFRVWMRILQRVPGSVLWMLRFRSNGEANMKATAQEIGVDPNRIIFSDRVSYQDHIYVKSLADLFLDTPRYNGHTSGLDILWAGVPMVTQTHERMATRVGASLASALGVPEMIVNSLADYEELAVELATSPKRIAQLREKVESARATSPLFDLDRWTRNFERGMEMAYLRFVQNLPPDFIQVHEPAV